MWLDSTALDPDSYRLVLPMSDPTHEVLTEEVWIELSDGCRLFAVMRRPEVSAPVPGVLIATPYGAKAGGAVHEHPFLRYLASRGYATVQVDLRGSCNSEGNPQPEYAQQEQDDLV